MDDKFEPPLENFYVPAPDPAWNQPTAWLNKKAISDREAMLYNIGVVASAALLSAGPGIYDNHSIYWRGFCYSLLDWS